MVLFIAVSILLVLATTFFIAFPFVTARMSNEKYASICERKIKRIARRRKLCVLTGLSISTFEQKRIYVDHILFGEKYIYLITNIKLKGFVVGGENDTSWLHYNYSKKQARYIMNLNELAKQNIQEFAGISGINTEPFVSICLIPNNCDFDIKGNKKQLSNIVHFSSLNRKLRRLEHNKIPSLDKEQIYEQYKAIKEANEQSKAN